MAASAASSPASATSPQALAPASSSSTNKSLVRPSPSLQTPSIFTNKEWVVPPRPKPGRKPAADTPPTKRKAQNRAAQRAFRERRAARVGELEERAQQIEEEHEKERESLQYRVQQLQVEVDRYSRLVVSWSTKCQRLEEELSNERRLGSGVEKRMRLDSKIEFGDGDAVPLRPSNGALHSGTDTSQASEKAVDTGLNDASMGCGKCSKDTRCECIEEVLEMSQIVDEAPTSTTKRPHSPASLLESKRNRHLDVKAEEEEREIDFTEQFSAKGLPSHISTSSNPVTVTTASDPCGFCQDGTACICAEMAADEKQSNSNIDVLATLTPAKSFGTSQNPCINGPGSCQQCRSDANSTLFCKSLAASRNRLRTQPVQSSETLTAQMATSSQTLGERAITGISLSCADAYATLSRHPAYERASEDPGAWIPKLATIPGGLERPAFEVEAASVMQTLRFFDRRFGREA